MTGYDAGYLQALKDVEITVCQMVSDLDSSPKDKTELFNVISFLAGLIQARVERYGDPDSEEAGNENAGERGD